MWYFDDVKYLFDVIMIKAYNEIIKNIHQQQGNSSSSNIIFALSKIANWKPIKVNGTERDYQ